MLPVRRVDYDAVMQFLGKRALKRERDPSLQDWREKQVKGKKSPKPSKQPAQRKTSTKKPSQRNQSETVAARAQAPAVPVSNTVINNHENRVVNVVIAQPTLNEPSTNVLREVILDHPKLALPPPEYPDTALAIREIESPPGEPIGGEEDLREKLYYTSEKRWFLHTDGEHVGMKEQDAKDLWSRCGDGVPFAEVKKTLRKNTRVTKQPAWVELIRPSELF